MEQDIIEDYRQRSAFAQQEIEKYKKLANTYSLYRLGAFTLFVFAVAVAISVDEIIIVAFSLLALVICFSWLVKQQNSFDNLKNYFTDVKKVADNEIASIENHSNIYDDGAFFTEDLHVYSSDLDIYGSNSLFQLVNRCATSSGIKKLGDWLKAPAEKQEILIRQEAVDEIAGKNDWKIDFQANLLFSLKQRREQIQNLVAYLNIPVEINGEKLLVIYSKFAPFILLAAIAGSVYYVPVRYFAIAIALYNYRLVTSRSNIIDKTDLIAGKIGTTLDHFVLAFLNIENEEWDSGRLKELSLLIKRNEGSGVSARIKQLSRLIHKLNYRLNFVIRFILNIFSLWDIRQVIAIENWKKENFRDMEQAFGVVAEFETLISLAGLRINYPEWCMPQIVESEGYTFAAKNLAHPLINSTKRIENNYELNDTFMIDIITGSNMAGKSTFLRTIGINAVLALCGAPVCAESLEISEIHIITYMRIKDSLNESTSTFKAELDRLQMLLKAVEGDQKIFFLIDEMLRGTNSVDKYLGSKAVIEQLIRKKAVGMVATHDLQIAELETAHPAYIRNFYFDIQVKNGEMIFDYKIKSGECKTFNASLLLKQIGIDIETA